jgi:FixJ family two-component response regulator
VFGIEDDAFPSTVDTLVEDMVFESGTSYLDKWTRLFAAIGFDQPITREDGLATAAVLSELDALEPEVTYAAQGDVEDAGRIKRDGSIDPLDPSLPNVVRYVARRGPSLPAEGNGWATFRNEDTGPGSISSRGFEVFRQVDADATNQTVLEAFGAADSQRVFAGGGRRFVGTVGFNPAHSDRDVVSFIRAGLGIDGGDWLMTSWTLPLRRFDGESAAVMPITAEQRVVVTAVP